MAEQHTLVIEFEDGKAPRYAAGDVIHGGRLVAVDFGGNRLEVAELLLDALQDMVDGDADAISEAEVIGIPFPDEMLAAYNKACAAISRATAT